MIVSVGSFRPLVIAVLQFFKNAKGICTLKFSLSSRKVFSKLLFEREKKLSNNRITEQAKMPAKQAQDEDFVKGDKAQQAEDEYHAKNDKNDQGGHNKPPAPSGQTKQHSVHQK